MASWWRRFFGREAEPTGFLFDSHMSESRLRELKVFCQQNGITLADLTLIDQALTHSSFAHETETATDYERLEFLGDSVISLYVVEYLFNTYPGLNEGDMTKIKSEVVSQTSLSEIATDLGLNRLMKLGKGEVLSHGRRKPSILSDTFEALVGAIYLSSTPEQTRRFVMGLLESRIAKLQTDGTYDNYKSLLQKVSLERFGENPTYCVMKKAGPQHNSVFVVGVEIKGKLYGRGTGRSRKDAEMQAAQKTLLMLRRPNVGTTANPKTRSTV
mgnify:CR=1 FL=1